MATAERAPTLWVATRKGAWTLQAQNDRADWAIRGPHFHGHIVHHVVADPRNPRHVVASVRTGHLGPTIMVSTNGGKSWEEAPKPPAFHKKDSPLSKTRARVVDHTFFLKPGLASEKNTWWAGTSPQGLFFSEDGGRSWTGVDAVNESKRMRPWMGTVQDGTPDGPKLHSITLDPRDPKHLMFGMSGGGVHESFDRGATWATCIEGMEVVDGFPTNSPTFHDPHSIVRSPADPSRLYQQNHCGIYRWDEGKPGWVRIGRAMPKSVGDVGFPICAHPRDRDTAWVFPMDGTDVWPRTAVGGKPAAFVTRNGGKTWKRQDAGMPSSQAWWTIKRQAMAVDAADPVSVYVGNTGGELWMGADEGAQWRCIARHLPEIYAITVAGS